MFSAQNISKVLNNKNILRYVSVDAYPGEVIGLLGPNGAGKSTFFQILAGIIFPDTGSITLNKKNITNFPISYRAKNGIAYLPQEISVFRNMSVSDNLMVPIELIEKNETKREQKLEELLAEFSIDHLRLTPAISLSGGERRRLEIARCIAINPLYLLLDEPLAGIDPIAVNNLAKLISKLKKRNIGIIITDHNVKEALSIIDRAYVLYDGKIIAAGTRNKIIQNTQVRNLYLGHNF